ncbi:MAG TPA: hypothetical protein VFS08_07620 [Gemmatimonadaceae bacterium]|nr:hypothetical protein [Gemmatimonadaceae bacterium]
MYSTCLYCHHHLGRNEEVERFPVGERLAFDAARGRLWVVCRGCGRWNLSPLEERWEAIEACERRFRDTRRRTSTEHIGLARLRSGLDLVRVGRPLRPEFAAWRYGGEFMRRRRRDAWGGVGVAVGAVAGLAAGAVVPGLVLGGVGFAVGVIGSPLALTAGSVYVSRRQLDRVVGYAPVGALEGSPWRAAVRMRHLPALRFHPAGDEPTLRVTIESDAGRVDVAGAQARQLAALACARRNQVGATPRYVRAAVACVESLGGPEGVLADAARTGALARVPYVARLALEMALHEEAERNALEGELRQLEEAWREAEEIAATADDLLLPRAVHEALARLRGAAPLRAAEPPA